MSKIMTANVKLYKRINIDKDLFIDIYKIQPSSMLNKSSSFTNSDDNLREKITTPKIKLRGFLITKEEVLPMEIKSKVDLIVDDVLFQMLCGSRELRCVVLDSIEEGTIMIHHSEITKDDDNNLIAVIRDCEFNRDIIERF